MEGKSGCTSTPQVQRFMFWGGWCLIRVCHGGTDDGPTLLDLRIDNASNSNEAQKPWQEIVIRERHGHPPLAAIHASFELHSPS